MRLYRKASTPKEEFWHRKRRRQRGTIRQCFPAVGLTLQSAHRLLVREVRARKAVATVRTCRVHVPLCMQLRPMQLAPDLQRVLEGCQTGQRVEITGPRTGAAPGKTLSERADREDKPAATSHFSVVFRRLILFLRVRFLRSGCEKVKF